MPFQSEAQRRLLWAKHPEIAERWAHEYPGQKNLPYHKKKSRKKKGSDMSAIEILAEKAADLKSLLKKTEKDMEKDEGKSKKKDKKEDDKKGKKPKEAPSGSKKFPVGDISKSPKNPFAGEFDRDEEKHAAAQLSKLANEALELNHIEKLAHDAQLHPDLIRQLAASVHLRPAQFVKLAYTDPADFVLFLKLASGAKVNDQEKQAAGKLSGLLQVLKKGLGMAGEGAVSAGKGIGRAAVGAKNMVMNNPKTSLGVGGAGLAGAGAAGMAMKGQPPQGPTEAASDAVTAASAAPQAPAQPQAPTDPEVQGSATGPAMSPAMQTLLAGGAGAGLGALGMGAAMRKKKKTVQASDQELFKEVMRSAIVKKAAQLARKQAAHILCEHLDKVASHLPLEKSAGLRQLQMAVAGGKPLSLAIKMAYPQLSGEQRGILATRMVEAAARWHNKRANGDCPLPGIPTKGMETYNGPVQGGLDFMRQG